MKEEFEIKPFDAQEIMVLDMDGTLYPHDGDNKHFKNSTLYKIIDENSIQFVINREGCVRNQAEMLIEEGHKDTIGVSNVLSKRYGITRAEYFDIAWNIDPKRVIRDSDIPKAVVQKLKLQGKRLFLLTASPCVWMENVVKYLDLDKEFERKYNGQMFSVKDEIFELLSKEFDPKTILSVGDQFRTDLRPAQERGMAVFEIGFPSDFNKLI